MQRPSTTAEAIVIGSGFAGSVVADQLVRAGISVIMLERGPWRDTVPVRSMGIEDRAPFPRGRQMFTQTIRSLNHGWLPHGKLLCNRRGLIEMFFGNRLNAICSSSVGGGSHVYSAVFRYPQVEVFWDGFCEEVSDASMRPHYESIRRRFSAVEPSADLKIPHLAGERFGPDDPVQAPPDPPPTWLGFLFPEEVGKPRKIVTADGIERWELDYNDPDGHGFLGSPSGAKTTVDFLYLAPLLKQGLDLRDLCEATAIVADPGDAETRYRVDYTDHKTAESASIYADHVFLAAGTMNTLALLLRSRDVTGTLRGMPQLGKRVGGNGDLFAFWDYNEPGRDLSTGLPFHGGFKIKDENYPIPLGGGGWPAAHKYPLPGPIKERIKRGAFTASMGVDAMDAIVSINKGKLAIDFNPDNSPFYAQVKATFRRMSAVTGKKIYYPKNPSTVHALGGARMDRDIDHGVVDAHGEVYGQAGLFVVDGAAMPRPPGGPPTMTIAAWAEHVAARFAQEIKR